MGALTRTRAMSASVWTQLIWAVCEAGGVHKPNLPLCGLYEHNDGKWVLDDSFSARPACCGWDRHKWGGGENMHMYLDDAEHCGGFEMPQEPYPSFLETKAEGWHTINVLNMAYKGRTDYLVHTGGYACSCQRFGFEDVYTWVPNECRLLEWDAKEFCRVLGNRSLLVLGDSTVSQAAGVLMNYIHLGFWDNPAQGCQTQVRFANSDTLVGVEYGVDNRGGEWKALIQYYAPDIVLLSTGPHINRPPPLRTADFTAILSQISQEHLERFPNVTLIWKTQAPGGCTDGISETFPREEFYKSLTYPNYNWADFEHWDWVARHEFTGKRNQYVLDMTPLYYRTDAHPGSHYYEGYTVDATETHPRTPVSRAQPGETQIQDRNRDCLHHCIPGPIGLLPQLLLHLMRVENI